MTAPTVAEMLKYADLQMAAEALYGFNAKDVPNGDPGSLAAGQGKAEGDVLETVLDALHKLIVGSDSNLRQNSKLNDGGTWADGVLRDAFYKAIDEINVQIKNQSLAGKINLVSLANIDAASLEKTSPKWMASGQLRLAREKNRKRISAVSGNIPLQSKQAESARNAFWRQPA